MHYSVAMLTRTPHADTLHFATLLTQALTDAGLHDPATIGALVAANEESSHRETLPYHPAMVTAWMQGRALPNESAFAALSDMLADKIHTTTLESTYESALLYGKTPSELGLNLQARYKPYGFTLSSLCKALAEHGVRTRYGTVYSPSGLANIISGDYEMPRTMAVALDDLLPCKEGEIPFQRLHDMTHPTPESFLEKAAQTNDIHRALRYMRRALGFSLQSMADAISEQLPEKEKLSQVSVLNWEKLSHKPYSSLPTTQGFGGSDAITVYGDILTEHGFGPWAEQHDRHLRAILKNAIDMRHQSLRQTQYAYRPMRPDISTPMR